MKKKKYMKPEQRIVLLQHSSALLAGSVMGPGDPNKPAASRDWDDEDDWDE